MLNQPGKFGLIGFVKLAGCDASECQLSLCAISSDDAKIYSPSSEYLRLAGASINLPIFFITANEIVTKIIESIIAMNTPERLFFIESSKQYLYKKKLANKYKVISIKEILYLESTSSFLIILSAINLANFLSTIAELIKVMAKHRKANSIVEPITEGKNSPDLAHEYINMFANTAYIKTINEFRYVLIYLFKIFGVNSFIKILFKKSIYLLIITLYQASRSDYARK